MNTEQKEFQQQVDPSKHEETTITKPIKAILKDRQSRIHQQKEYCIEYQDEEKGHGHWVAAHLVESIIPKTVQRYQINKQARGTKRSRSSLTTTSAKRRRINREKLLRTEVNETDEVEEGEVMMKKIRETTAKDKDKDKDKKEAEAEATESKEAPATTTTPETKTAAESTPATTTTVTSTSSSTDTPAASESAEASKSSSSDDVAAKHTATDEAQAELANIAVTTIPTSNRPGSPAVPVPIPPHRPQEVAQEIEPSQ